MIYDTFIDAQFVQIAPVNLSTMFNYSYIFVPSTCHLYFQLQAEDYSQFSQKIMFNFV